MINFKLSQPIPRIFLLQIEDQHDLAMTFWRAQEFYESSNPNFQGNAFNFADYSFWYSKHISPVGSMTYANDWAGFNVPGMILEEAYRIHTERTPYDRFMLKIMEACEVLAGFQTYYLIGTSFEDPYDALNHELAHGLYTADLQYRSRMNHLIGRLNSFDRTFVDRASVALNEMGYSKSVCWDELQANMATGLCDALSKLGLQEHTREFEIEFEKAIGSYQIDKRALVIAQIKLEDIE